MKWRSFEESTPETEIRPLREALAERKELVAKYVLAETQAISVQEVNNLPRQYAQTKKMFLRMAGMKLPGT